MTLRGNERAAALTKLRNLVIQKRQQQQMRDTSTAGNAGGSVEDDAIRVAQVDSALQLQRRNTKFAPGMLVDLWNDTTAAGVSSKFQAEQAARWASWMKQDAQAIRRDALETRRRVAQLKGAVIDDSDKLKTTATAISNIGNGSCPPEDVSIQTSI